MAQNVIVTLIDDLDGSDADETVDFSLDGRDYQIDLNQRHAAELRQSLRVYLSKARAVRNSRTPSSSSSSGRSGSATLFSQLDAEEKDRFRAWANLPTARRIADQRVRDWTEAGRP